MYTHEPLNVLHVDQLLYILCLFYIWFCPCYNNTCVAYIQYCVIFGLVLRNVRDHVMLTKIIGSCCVGFDNLLAPTIIVGKRININATNSEETQKMPELMAAANYCNTCLLRQNNSINFGNVTRNVFALSNKKIHIHNLTKMIINVTVRDRDYFLTKVLELQGLY